MKQIPEGFKGIWIPREIWLSKEITTIEKCLLMQINALTSDNSGCYATNAYFAEFMQLDVRSIQRHLKVLYSKGYIKVTYANPTNKTGRTMYTNMSLQTKWGDNNVIPAMTEVSQHGVTKVSQVVKREVKSLDKQTIMSSNLDDAVEVINFLNQKTGRQYRPTSSNLKLVKERMKDYTLQELKTMVARKCREWKADPQMNKYLRPATLFNATKCDQYVGECV